MNCHGGVEHISECFIKPKFQVQEAKQPYYLSPWDLMLLGIQYNQKGLLYTKPNIDEEEQGLFSINKLLESLKDSLSLTLVHFYPLAGQLATIVDHDRHRSLVFVDCEKGPGVRFLYATFNARVSDILSQDDSTQSAVKYFFDHNNGEVNYDGHNRPLLTVQITELIDGIFIGCSMNHTIADGTSFWHFWNVWCEIHGGSTETLISNIPYHKRWVPDGYNLADIYLPYIHRDEFIRRHTAQSELVLKSRFFHFPSQNITKLKSKANEELNINSHGGTKMQVSSFQALIAFVWRSIVRTRGSNPDQLTTCTLAANDRSRLDPPLPKEYFGNALSGLNTTALVGELLRHDIGWATLLLHQVVVNHTEEAVRDFFNRWFESYSIINFVDWHDQDSNKVHVGSSPRFRVFENRFAELGKPVAVRTGDVNKFSGKVTAFPSYEGGGSVDLEICLPHDSMKALELDLKSMVMYHS